MHELTKLMGQEFTIKKISRDLWYLVQRLRPVHVGAMQVTCADESEYECAQAFQQGFVQHYVPQLKFAHQAPFRISNLGGRYEKGAMAIAENHFCPSVSEFTVMVVKINSHVGALSETKEEGFGFIERYGRLSPCCGALSALMNSRGDSKQTGFIKELGAGFKRGDIDALQILHDAGRVEPKYRSLFAAIVSARLQAERVIRDIRRSKHPAPVLHLVVPCVTINRPETDTEILCGLYRADNRSGSVRIQYAGLGHDPAKYKLSISNRRILIEDTICEND